jgi:hypothetical protein
VIVGQPQFGFSITDPFKAVGRGIATGAKYAGRGAVAAGRAGYRAAQDPRVQRAAAAAAQAYAPAQYAQASEYADRARGILMPPGQAPMPMPQMPMPGGDEDMGPPAPGGPVQRGNMITIAALVGAGLIVFLLLRK